MLLNLQKVAAETKMLSLPVITPLSYQGHSTLQWDVAPGDAAIKKTGDAEGGSTSQDVASRGNTQTRNFDTLEAFRTAGSIQQAGASTSI
jgi:hypothetical protein